MKKVTLLALILSIRFVNAQLNEEMIYKFDLNGNSNDASTNQLNGTVFGAISAENRNLQANSSMSFDGVDDYIATPNSSLIKCQFPLTISFWTNVNEVDDGIFFHSDFNSGQYFGYWVGLTTSMQVHINFGDGGAAGGGSRRTKVSDLALTPNTWQHITCIIRSADDMDIYIGCQNAGGSYSGSGGDIMYSASVGRLFSAIPQGGNPAMYFDGQLDDVRLWSRELTISEITSFCSPINLVNSELETVNSCGSVSLVAPIATDLDGNVLVGVSNTSFPITNTGLTVVEWTYTDSEGNTEIQTQSVNISQSINAEVVQIDNTLSSSVLADSYQWYKCENSVLIVGANLHDYNPPIEGEYFLVLNSGECTDTSVCVKFESLSVANQLIEIQNFPNPVVDFLTLKLENYTNVSCEIYDQLGKLLTTKKVIDNKFHFHNF